MWEKIVLSDWEKLFKFEVEGQEFAKFLRSLEQFIWTVKCQNNFCNRILIKIGRNNSDLEFAGKVRKL